MNPTFATTELLDQVAGELPAGAALAVVDGQGNVAHGCGGTPAARVAVEGDARTVVADDGFESCIIDLPGGEGAVLGTWPVTFDQGVRNLLRYLVGTVADREQLEQDMESMNAGSLALLEEVSMMGETLPSLATGASYREIAGQALRALMVTTSVERGMFVAYDPTQACCEVLVHCELDESGFQGVETAYEGSHVFEPEGGLFADVLRGVGNAVHLSREVGAAPLGPEGSLEAGAEHDIIAVPVSCGSGEQPLMLGALVIIDKRTNSFSYQDRLGSSETKLAQAIAAMLGAVLGARQVAEMGKELAMAQQIQAQILPDRSTRCEGFDVYADYRTSGEVGGDYYDYLPLSDGRTMAVVADVSGHNLASGMVMVSARAALRVLAAGHASPDSIFEALAAAMFDDLTRTERFITAAALTLTPGGRQVEFVSAGHNDVMWYHAATDDVERLPSESTILGFLPSADYPSRQLDLEPGDVLLLYTDGVTEAVNEHAEMFGEERLETVLREAARGDAREIIASVFGAVRGFADRNDRGDDITAIAIKSTMETGGKS